MLIPDLFQKHQVSPRGIVHIGAHACEERGIYHAAGLTDSEILWIEAMPHMVERTMAALPPSVKVVQAVIADTEKEVEFYVTNNDGESSSFLPLGEHRHHHPTVHEVGTLQLRTTTLPALLERIGEEPSRFDFLAMDIQGAEYHALLGMEQILKHFRYIYLEVNTIEVYQGCGRLGEVQSLLARHGFKMVDIHMTPHGWGDAFFVKASA